MRKWWKRSLALTLGLVAGGARAGDPVPAVQVGRPVIASSGSASPVATLDRPIALSEVADRPQPVVVDPSLRPTGYSPESDTPLLIYRGQAPDQTGPKPMPPGPVDPTLGSTPSATVWRRNPGNGTADGAAAGAGAATVVASSGQATAPTTDSPAVPSPAGPPPAITGPAWAIMHGNWNDYCSGTCSADDCGACACSFGNCFYVSADYLLWWIKGSKTPPLVTQGSAGDPIPGAIGSPGTVVLFGGGSVENNPFSGGRLSAGYWFGDQHLLGVDFGGFFLGQRGENFTATSMGNPILTRPFVNALNGTETVEVVAAPGILAGTASVTTRSELWGYESNLRSNFFAGQVCGIDYYVDGILGFRGLGLNEGLGVNESLVIIGGTPETATHAGQQFNINDSFSTQNRFYGGQVGFLSELRWNRWVLDVNTKIAMGTTQELVDISGSTTRSFGGSSLTTPGGLLTQPTNIGRFTRDAISWVPELGLNLGYQCTDHIRLYVGYSFLYWSDVVRPGQQIDRTVNPNQLAGSMMTGGPARPQFTFNGSDFWAQGVNFGIEFKY